MKYLGGFTQTAAVVDTGYTPINDTVPQGFILKIHHLTACLLDSFAYCFINIRIAGTQGFMFLSNSPNISFYSPITLLAGQTISVTIQNRSAGAEDLLFTIYYEVVRAGEERENKETQYAQTVAVDLTNSAGRIF